MCGFPPRLREIVEIGDSGKARHRNDRFGIDPEESVSAAPHREGVAAGIPKDALYRDLGAGRQQRGTSSPVEFDRQRRMVPERFDRGSFEFDVSHHPPDAERGEFE